MPTPTPVPYFGLFGGASDPLVQTLINIIRGLIVFAIALLLANLAKRWVVRLFTRGRVTLNIATLLGNLAQVAIIFLGVVFILPSFGVDWAGLLTLVGAAGLAISLSMQDLLKNVIAGVYLLMEQPFRIGERITVRDATGTVQGIELRTTVLRTDEDLQVVVPNSMVLTEIVTNRSVSNLKRQTVVVSVRKGSLTGISQELSDVLKGFDQIAAQPAPVVALQGVEGGVARLNVEFWASAPDRIAITSQVVQAIQARFPEADLIVP